jgi:hypothetical protein
MLSSKIREEEEQGQPRSPVVGVGVGGGVVEEMAQRIHT